MIRDILRPALLPGIAKAKALGGRMLITAPKRAGKSRLALAIAEELGCQRVALIGEDAYMGGWERELWKIERAGQPFPLPFYRMSSSVSAGSNLKRALFLKQIVQSGQPAMVGLNYEAWQKDDLREWFRRWAPDMIIYDEADYMIGRGNRSAQFALQIASREKWFKYCLALTATRQERGYEDIFYIYRACNPAVFGTNILPFRARYCRMGGFKGKKVVGYYNEDELFRRIRDTSFDVPAAELHIPDPTEEVVPVELSPAAREQYDAFIERFLYRFQSLIDQKAAMEILVKIQLSAQMKAQELTSGWIQDSSKRILDISSEKLDAVVARAKAENQAGYQHAIYTRFVHDVERLCEALGIPARLTYSELAGKDREQALDQLFKGNLPTIVCSESMIARGTDLTPCRAASYMAPEFGLRKYDQLRGRLQGENLYPHHYHFIVKDSIDVDIYETLARKQDKVSRFDGRRNTIKALLDACQLRSSLPPTVELQFED